MGSDNERFKHESLQDCQSLVNYLNALSKGFDEGSLMFSTDDKRLILSPQGLINLEVEAKRKDGDIKLTIRLRWSEEKALAENKRPSLIIEPITSE